MGVIEKARIKLLQDSVDRLAAENKRLQEKVHYYQSCWIIKGWFCAHCDRFNGEEKDVTLCCRVCDKPKKARAML